MAFSIRHLALAACVALSTACSGITYTVPSKGGDDEKPATVAPKRRKYTLAMPVNNPLLTALLPGMMQTFNAGVGFDLVVVPTPFVEPTSAIKWTESTDGLEGGACAGTADGDAKMVVTMNVAYATKFFPERAHVSDTDYYRAFVHCLGHGLGMKDEDAAGDVMQPDFAAAKDFDAFYARVRALTDAAAASAPAALRERSER